MVDVQNDFCSPEGACARRGMDIKAGLEMMPNLYKLIDEAREVSLPIIYIQTVHSEWTDTEPWLYRTARGADTETCREGSWGVDFFDGIEPRADERVVIKHRYSAFINTDLDTILKAKGIESVLLTGVATNVCVESTMRDAFMLGLLRHHGGGLYGRPGPRAPRGHPGEHPPPVRRGGVSP